MGTIPFDVTAFRLQFPAFNEKCNFLSDATLTAFFNTASLYVSKQTTPCGLIPVPKQTEALYLMTAHLAAISDIIKQGNTPGLVTSATIDKISVSFEPPPGKTQFQWWLSLTPYGQQLYALLQIAGAGGFYFGGLPERSAFRKVGGIF